MKRLHRGGPAQNKPQTGLSPCADGHFGALSWLRMDAGGPLHQVAYAPGALLMLLPTTTWNYTLWGLLVVVCVLGGVESCCCVVQQIKGCFESNR